MKILILYTYNKGLLSEFFQELSGKLNTDGFEVVNFYLKHHKNYFEQNGVAVYGERRGNFVHNYKVIYQIIKKTKPDVIISNFSYINPAILFGKLLRVKHNIAWFHTAYGHTKPSWLKVLNKMMYLNMANWVLTNSKSLQKEMHSIYKVSKRKTRCIPFWTNISNYCSQSKSLSIKKSDSVINIGCPGRLLADKNHSMVIEAVYRLKKTHTSPMRLYIAGNGSYRNKLETLVKDLKLEQEVVFLGLLNVNEMAAYYEAMDVVVLPSFHEAFGLVFIEAIALGTPVLVSKAFGALDFINSQKFPLEDYTFNPQEPHELIYKLAPYLNHRGFNADYFKTMYSETFEKEVIYKKIKAVILNQKLDN
ncbi:glycosyltransferase [Gelidibacter maritimus]|uniref:Glycosyltransferase n=1 Tax=Gelidibacter maritimus TaxID=2761487 RepID=A0A7W2M4P6_9FLAO|nr:glycosyltransferase [Gelidibacter maritimus]MBA6152679.1 glycosyltransferase [Gelidibacter maritimus]